MLESYGPVGFLATATSGLSPAQDKLLAAAYIILDGDDRKEGRIMQLVSKEELDKAADYHKITVSMQLAQGLNEQDFTRELSQLMQSGVNWFSYNPQFHGKFIAEVLGYPVVLRDLPRMAKLAASGMAMPSTMTLDKVEDASFSLIKDRVVSYKQSCQLNRIPIEVPAGVMPYVHCCRNMERLFCSISSLPVNVQQTEEY